MGGGVTRLSELHLYNGNEFPGPAQAGISKTSNNPSVVHHGVFSTASYATHKIRFKDVELWQICNDLLQKTPKIGNSSKVGVQ